MALNMVCWSPKTLEMALEPFPDYFILHLFCTLCLDGSVTHFLISQSLFKYFILLTELRVINVPPE